MYRWLSFPQYFLDRRLSLTVGTNRLGQKRGRNVVALSTAGLKGQKYKYYSDLAPLVSAIAGPEGPHTRRSTAGGTQTLFFPPGQRGNFVKVGIKTQNLGCLQASEQNNVVAVCKPQRSPTVQRKDCPVGALAREEETRQLD